MADRRQNEQPVTPEKKATARLNSMKFREGDDERAVLLAMAEKINARYGVVLAQTSSTVVADEGKTDAMLEALIIDDVEIAKYLDGLVDAQYQGSLETLKQGEKPLYDQEQPKEGDVQPPTLEQAKEILATQVTPEQLEVIKRMEKPTLQLIPVTSMARYAEALDGFKPMDGQKDANVSDWHKKAFTRADKRDGVKDNTIIGWRIAVTEGAKEPKLLEGDDVNKTLRQRNAWFNQEFGKKGVSGVDLKRILVLMMESLKNGEPVNDYIKHDETWTFVNEEPEKDGYVSGAYWYGVLRQVRLDEGSADAQYDIAGFRVSVVVDVPKSV
ncbi:MAG: hypothetical protein Q8P62_00050 [Candidatus Peregrinibacteria bacterium]|nr:hypothetical protein [Candidatus Peregrinibacteria bacterium]